MTDEFSSDSIPAPPPADIAPSPSPPPDASEVINENRHIALSQLAKSEDISQYAAEREDQDAVIDRGEDIPQERRSQWFRRAHKARPTPPMRLRASTRMSRESKSRKSSPGYVPGDEAQRGVERARKEGAAQLRVAQYFGDNAEKKQEIINWHDAMDPEHHIAEWVIQNESAVAPQILERLERLSRSPAADRSNVTQPAGQDAWNAGRQDHGGATLRAANGATTAVLAAGPAND